MIILLEIRLKRIWWKVRVRWKTVERSIWSQCTWTSSGIWELV